MSQNPSMLVAGGNINPCRFVKRDSSADHQGLEGSANAIVCGIAGESSRLAPLENYVTTNYHAIAGEPIRLHPEGDTDVLLEMVATCSAGDRLKSDASGKGTPILTTGTTIQHFGAIAEEACGIAGQKIKVRVFIGSERPALA